MPTPRPIIAATVDVKSAVGRTAEISGMVLSDSPMPISAVTIGNPMATIDPNAISRMTAAAARPIPSVAGTSPFRKGSPPSAICRSGDWWETRYLLDRGCRFLDRWWPVPHEGDSREGDPSGPDLLWVIDGAVDVVDTRQRPNFVDDGARGDQVGRLEVDGAADSGDRRHVRCRQVVGALRIRAIEAVVDVGTGVHHPTDDDHADEGGEPDDERAVTVVYRGGGKFVHHALHCEAGGASAESGGPASSPGGYPHLP